MAENGSKKWRSDYSSLLKCWSVMKTSDMMKEMATDELKRFKAEDRALQHLKGFLERTESETSFGQSVCLWNQTIRHFLRQQNFFEAAECYENLSDILFKYGSTHDKRKALEALLGASKCYQMAKDNKRALMSMKRLLSIIEFSPKNDMKSIVDRYKDCSALYDSLDLPHLANINRKMAEILGEDNNNSYFGSNASVDHWIPQQVLTPSSVEHNSTDDESDIVDNPEEVEEEIDSKELVRQQINQMNASIDAEPVASTSAAMDCEWSDNSEEHSEPKRKKLNSKQRMRKNLNTILMSSQIQRSVGPKNVSKNTEREERMTTQITCSPITPPKRAKRKPKEQSEESPERRLHKLEGRGYRHNFIVDPENPSDRLLCVLCKESILCYRWSSVTDHLRAKKHNGFEVVYNQRIFESFQSIENINCIQIIDNNNTCISILKPLTQNEGKVVSDKDIPVLSLPNICTPVATNLVTSEPEYDLFNLSLNCSLVSDNQMSVQTDGQTECGQSFDQRVLTDSLHTPPPMDSNSNPFLSAFK